MATYYWVGGAGTWDNASTTHWATSSGGAGGAGVPTSADNAIFDNLSNATAYAVTVGANAVAADITIAGPAAGNVTITLGATAVINCYGSWINSATGVVFSTTSGSLITFLATTTGKTITTNNVSIASTGVVFNSASGGWTLGSAFAAFYLNPLAGTFSTGNFNVTLGANLQRSAVTGVATINLGSSTVTCGGITALSLSATNLTLNAGTSTIVCSHPSPTFAGGGLTYYNVNFTGTTGNTTTTITGNNTFNNLSQSTPSSNRKAVSFGSSQVITGTFTPGATNGYNQRVQVISTTSGSPITLTVATISTLSDVDFRDITAAGASGTWSGTRLGNGLGNTNITFDAGKTVYWNLVAGGNWSANAWATSSGGAVSTANFPLAQDTVIIDDAGLTAGNTITVDGGWYIGTLNCTRTNAWTFAGGTTNATYYGDFAIPSVTTATGTGTYTFQGQGLTQTLTTNGVSLTMGVNVTSVGGTLLLNGAVTCASTVTVTLNNGTLNLNNYTLTTGLLIVGSSTNALAFGTGNITLTGVGTIFTGSTNCTVTGTPLIICTNSSATARTITPGAVTEANSISFRITAGTGTLSLPAGSYRNLDFTDGVNPTGYAGALGNAVQTIYGNFKASTGMTRTPGTSGLNFAATSGTKTIDTAGVTFDCPFTFNGVGGTWQLQAALTSGATRTVTLTNGTLDLNGYTVTTGLFSSNNSNTRVLAFGTGKIVLTNNGGTILSMSTVTNFSYTGTSRIECVYSGSTGTRTIVPPATGAVESNVLNIYVTAGTDTVTVSGACRILTFDLTGFSGTLTYASTSRYFGDLVFSSGMTLGTISSSFTFSKTSGTQTITSSGKTIGNSVTIDAPGATVSLQDALSMTGTLTLTNGTFTTNGYAVTAGVFSSSNTNTRTLNLGASTVTITGTGTSWNITDPTNMTFNAGTSSIVFTGTASALAFANGGQTYYNVTAPDSGYRFDVVGSATYNQLTVPNSSTAAEKTLRFDTNQTIGTFTVTGATGNCRILVFSNPAIVGAQVTLTATSVSFVDADFRDIAAAGSSTPWTGTRLGNYGNNTNITFGAGKTVYWNKVAGGSWGDDAWALTSGGATSTLNHPLGQDVAVFDDTGITAGGTVVFGNYVSGGLNCSSLTNALIIQTDSTYLAPGLYKDITLSSAVSFSGTANIGFSARAATQYVTSAGVNWSCGVTFNSIVTVVLVDNLATDDASFTSGSIDLNSKTLTCNTFSSVSTSTRSIAFGSGSIDVAGSNATVWSCADLTGFSYTGTPTVNFTYSGSTGARSIANGSTAGGTEANAVDFNVVAGGDVVSFSGATAVARNFTVQAAFTGSTGLFSGGYIYGNLLLSPNQTVTSSTGATTFAATSGTKTITTNGVTIDRPFIFNGVGGTWSLQDALTLGATNGTLAITGGTFNTNNYNVTASTFGGTGTSVRAINLGSSTITVTGNFSTTVGFSTTTNLTFNAGTSTFDLAGTGVSTKTFQGGGLTFYKVRISGNSPTAFSSGNTRFYELSNTVTPLTVTFGNLSAPMYFDNFLLSGTAGNLLTLSSTVPGSQFLMAKNTGGKVLVSYVSVTDSNVTPAGYWFAPTSQGNVDGSNNTGWDFARSNSTDLFLAF